MTERELSRVLVEDYCAPYEAGRELNVSTTRVGQLVTERKLRAMPTPLGKIIERASLNALLRERQARSARSDRRGR